MTRRPGPTAPKSPRIPWLLAGLCLTLNLGCGDASEGHKGSRPRSTVEVYRVVPGSLRNVAKIPGQLEAGLAVVVKPEIEGVIEAIEFREGSEVEAGRILFRLRSSEQRARLREAEAQLALAEDVHRRTRKLAKRDISSAAQLDRAAAELAVANARLEVAQVAMARTEIRAPFDGVMGALQVAPGDRVREQTGLVRIDALDRLQLLFSLPEVAVGLVDVGTPVTLSVAPYPGERFSGSIYFVSPTLDPRSRSLLLKAWIPNADRRLRPGLFASIEAEIEHLEDALMVPESSIAMDLQGSFVWRVRDEDRVERVPVGIGLRQSGRVQILSGLSPGDVVVSAGTHKLSDGSRIDRALRSGESQAREDATKDATPGADS